VFTLSQKNIFNHLGNKFFIKNTGLINASGKDLIDFINRMSTNDFKKLPAGEFRKSILTTDKGRIIDLINVLNFEEDTLILTSNDFQDKIITHLDKYIIMDDVKLEKEKKDYCQIIVYGDDLIAFAKKLFNTEIEKNKVYKAGEEEILFIDDFKINSLNIICSKESGDKFRSVLLADNIKEMSCTEYEYIRIDAGIPEGVNEFNDQINPMECGLDDYISFAKGCYIGQEVIARLDSQGKRPKQMVKIKSESELMKDDKIFTEDDKETGFISSAINNNGNFTALGFIRSVNLDFEKSYSAEHNKEKFKINITKID